MLKQSKNSNFRDKVTKRYSNRKTFKVNLNKKHKNFLRVRKTFRFRCHISNPIFRQISNKNISKNFSKRISIKIRPNNVFCTLVENNSNKILYTISSGKCNIKTSKKTLRYSSKIILQSFFDNVKKYLKRDYFLVNIDGPKKIKKSVLELLSLNLKNKNVIIDVKGKKCFNGCRPPKKKRKKQKGLRIFK